jgi:hypothetical protein
MAPSIDPTRGDLLVKRLLSLALLAALATTAVSCSDSTGPGSAIAGTYTLRSIDGVQIPVQLSGYQVLGGQIVLDAAGNYAGITTIRQTNGFTFDDRIDGYWTVSGNQINLYDESDPSFPYIGTITNNSITILAFNSGSGYDEVYTK